MVRRAAVVIPPALWLALSLFVTPVALSEELQEGRRQLPENWRELWRYDPEKEPERCPEDLEVRVCPDGIRDWILEDLSRVGDPRSPGSDELTSRQMRALLGTAGCWAWVNGFYDCGVEPCLLPLMPWGRDPRTVAVALAYPDDVLTYYEERWDSGRRSFAQPVKVWVQFGKTENGYVWWGPGPAREHGPPRACELGPPPRKKWVVPQPQVGE